MGCGLTSGLTSGKQLTLEQESLNIQIADNEAKVRDDYIKNIHPKSESSSPYCFSY